MEDSQETYSLYGIALKSKWFPVFYVLSPNAEKSITDIAGEIYHSHPSVSKIVQEMIKSGIVEEKKDPNDRRRNLIRLTEKGRKILHDIQPQYQDVTQAVEHLMNQTQNNLWKALDEFEYLLHQQSLISRIREQKKKRESQAVQIVAFQTSYATAFKQLNEAWIRKYFEMEETDHHSLDHPKEYILDRGGHILIALYEKEPVGTAALIKMNHPDFDFELAKMAVAPEAQGKGIGWLLGQASIGKARAMGAKSIYLESNTILGPAIALYEKLGFCKITGYPSPYARCNIQMALYL